MLISQQLGLQPGNGPGTSRNPKLDPIVTSDDAGDGWHGSGLPGTSRLDRNFTRALTADGRIALGRLSGIGVVRAALTCCVWCEVARGCTCHRANVFAKHKPLCIQS